MDDQTYAYVYRPAAEPDPERELARLLARFPTMGEPADRQAVVRALARRGTDILANAPRSSRLLEDVLGMVQTAADQPGGLRLLLDTIGGDYRNSTHWAVADGFLRRNFLEPLLTPDERDRLFELLRGIAYSTIEDMLRFAVATYEEFGDRLDMRRDRAGHGESDLRALVAVLEDAPVMPGRVHPLTAFVESVAAPEDPSLRDRFQWWNGRLTTRQEWPVALMRDARAQAAMEIGRVLEESCLLIEVHSRAPAPATYDVGAWLTFDGREPHRLQAAVRVSGQDELDRCVNDLHEQALRVLAELAPGMRVEFLLPWHLIWLPLDQTVIEPRGAIGRTLGSHRNVVVRSTERQDTPEWHAALRKRWNWLKNHAAEDREGTVVWLGPQERITPADLLAQLRNTSETPAVYVLLEPPRHTWNRTVDYLPVLIEMGIPVVLAVRRVAADGAVRERLETYLRGMLKDLPERVWALRKDTRVEGADGGEADALDLHRHITLLWDSPEGLRQTKAVLRQPRSWGD